MKTISVLILFISLLAASFSQWLLIAAYEINQNYITKELCVNRNNVTSHCNGHCYLNKQLNNQENTGTTNSNTSKEKFEVQLFCMDEICGTDKNMLLQMQYPVAMQPFSPQQFIPTCFHPPCIA